MSLRRNILWNLIPVGLLGLVGLGANVAIARWRGPAALGVFNQVTTAYFIAAVLGAFGLPPAVLRGVATVGAARDEVRVAELTAAAAAMATVAGAVVAAALAMLSGVLAAWWGSPETGEGLLWVAPGALFFVINKVLLAVVNGRGRMRAFAIYTSVRYAMIGVGLACVFALSDRTGPLGAVWTIAEGVLLIVLVAETAASLPWRAVTPRWRQHCAALWAYGGRSLPATLGVELNSRMDVWVLGALTTDAAMGVYSLVATVGEGVMQFALLAQNNLNPTLVRLTPDELAPFVGRVQRWFMPLFIGICGVATVVYSVGASPIAGAAFKGGVVAFATLMAGWSLASFYLPFAQVLVLRGRPRTHSAIVNAGLMLNIAVTWALFDAIGIVAAAAGAAASVVGQMLATRYFATAEMRRAAEFARPAATISRPHSAHTTNQCP